ncbi:MAG: hypothetical protein AAGA48_17805 [Myxococcota bacterium]
MPRFDLRFSLLVALSSCIIYQVESGPREPIEAPQPELPPLPTGLELVVNEAAAGDALRTVLITDDPVGLGGLQEVRFERDVSVIGALYEPNRADLAIEVAKDATPGAIAVVVQFEQGQSVTLDRPFAILPAQNEKDSSLDTGTTRDTGAMSTGDTGTTDSTPGPS